MNKNDKVVARCIDYTADGQGVVKIDGYPLFVKGLILDELAEIKVTKANKNYGYGAIVKVVETSEHRRDLPCPYAKLCGGCQLQHMDEIAQVEMKRRNVDAVVKRVGKQDLDVNQVLSTGEFHYRNKTQIPVQVVDGKLQMGFYRRHSNEIIDMQSCMIQSNAINELYLKTRNLLEKHLDIAKELRHVLYKHAVGTDELMIVFITRKKEVNGLKRLVEKLVERDSRVVSVIQNINQRNDNVILGDEEILLYNKEYITDNLLGLEFAISSKSFYQINYHQTHVLYKKAIEYAQLNGTERVLDLYCGLGTISLYAATYAKEVVGVEIVEDAIVNAKRNSKINGIDNIQFVCSDAASFAAELEKKKEKFDVIIVDPPRKGLDDVTIESICKMNPKRLVYVSCDPSTLARDLNKLTSAQYECVEIQPVDMFPQTYHIENVALLIRK